MKIIKRSTDNYMRWIQINRGLKSWPIQNQKQKEVKVVEAFSASSALSLTKNLTSALSALWRSWVWVVYAPWRWPDNPAECSASVLHGNHQGLEKNKVEWRNLLTNDKKMQRYISTRISQTQTAGMYLSTRQVVRTKFKSARTSIISP